MVEFREKEKNKEDRVKKCVGVTDVVLRNKKGRRRALWSILEFGGSDREKKRKEGKKEKNKGTCVEKKKRGKKKKEKRRKCSTYVEEKKRRKYYRNIFTINFKYLIIIS